jgi:hypothetical protein
MEGRISPFSVETHDEFIESLLNTPKSTEQLPQPKSPEKEQLSVHISNAIDQMRPKITMLQHWQNDKIT